MVPGCSVAADIGTDHGYLPIWLLENGICKTAIAADINSGPLSKAKDAAVVYAMTDRISFRLCDGLASIQENEAEVVIIAGMGGETIEGILSAAPWTITKTLIIQPQSKIPELRLWLHKNGYRVENASLVYDASRYYVIWRAVNGSEPCPDILNCHVDRLLFENKDPLLPGYLNHLISRNNAIISGLEKSSSSSSDAQEIRHLNEQFAKMLKECEKWQK